MKKTILTIIKSGILNAIYDTERQISNAVERLLERCHMTTRCVYNGETIVVYFPTDGDASLTYNVETTPSSDKKKTRIANISC